MKLSSVFHNDKAMSAITWGLLILGLACLAYVFLNFFNKRSQISQIGNTDCVKESSSITVTDTHMSGIFSVGDTATVLMNFYNCNEPKKGDLALYRFSPQINPVIRIVQGVPGDQYDLIQDSTEKNKWVVQINQETLMVNGQPYFVISNSVPPLKTYSESRQGRLNPDEYILLSNIPPGLSDSSNLGLIKRADLIGKVASP